MSKLKKMKKQVEKNKDFQFNYRNLKGLKKEELRILDNSIPVGYEIEIKSKTKNAYSSDLEAIKLSKGRWLVIDSNYMNGKFKSLKKLLKEFKRTSI